MTHIRIAASTMAAPAAQLGSAIHALDTAGIDIFHWDIMDGHFVPNMTFGPHIIRDARPLTSKPFDVHLMVTDPMRWIPIFAENGADVISFHIEATTPPQECIQAIRDAQCAVGIALNPETPLDAIPSDLFGLVDRLVIMTVKPGFGGQSFMPQEDKIQAAAHLRKTHPHLDIMVDGGINTENCHDVIAQGATTLVSGSALLHSTDFAETIQRFKGGRA